MNGGYVHAAERARRAQETAGTPAPGSAVRLGNLPIDKIVMHPMNVRRDLGDLRDLAASIRQLGVLQPIEVERRGDHFRVRHGHRRLAAVRIAGRTHIPAIIHPVALAGQDFLIAAVHENTRRRGMNFEDQRATAKAMLAEGMLRSDIRAELQCSRAILARMLDEEVAPRPAVTTSASNPRRIITNETVVRDLVEAATSRLASGEDARSVLHDLLAVLGATLDGASLGDAVKDALGKAGNAAVAA